MSPVGGLRLIGAFAALALALATASGATPSPNYDGAATRAAARADTRASVTSPDASDLPIGSPEMRFRFELTHNSGEVTVYGNHSDAEQAFTRGKAIARKFGVSLEDFVLVERNIVVGFEKTPTRAERREVEAWLRVS
jgi:hypothetical protein